MDEQWMRINDERVRHIWVHSDNCDCDEDFREITDVSPDFYERNGTPVCECGEDMEYSHTEILMPDVAELKADIIRALEIVKELQ